MSIVKTTVNLYRGYEATWKPEFNVDITAFLVSVRGKEGGNYGLNQYDLTLKNVTGNIVGVFTDTSRDTRVRPLEYFKLVVDNGNVSKVVYGYFGGWDSDYSEHPPNLVTFHGVDPRAEAQWRTISVDFNNSTNPINASDAINFMFKYPDDSPIGTYPVNLTTNISGSGLNYVIPESNFANQHPTVFKAYSDMLQTAGYEQRFNGDGTQKLIEMFHAGAVAHNPAITLTAKGYSDPDNNAVKVNARIDYDEIGNIVGLWGQTIKSIPIKDDQWTDSSAWNLSNWNTSDGDFNVVTNFSCFRTYTQPLLAGFNSSQAVVIWNTDEAQVNMTVGATVRFPAYNESTHLALDSLKANYLVFQAGKASSSDLTVNVRLTDGGNNVIENVDIMPGFLGLQVPDPNKRIYLNDVNAFHRFGGGSQLLVNASSRKINNSMEDVGYDWFNVAGTNFSFNDVECITFYTCDNASYVSILIDRPMFTTEFPVNPRLFSEVLPLAYNQSSIDVYGRRFRALTDNRVLSVADALTVQSSELSKNKDPARRVLWRTVNALHATPGKLVTVNSPVYGVHSDLGTDSWRVLQVNHEWDTGGPWYVELDTVWPPTPTSPGQSLRTLRLTSFDRDEALAAMLEELRDRVDLSPNNAGGGGGGISVILNEREPNPYPIETNAVSNYAITNAKIANLTVTNAQIENATITNAQIANYTILNSNIVNGTITNSQIANYSITNSQIANFTITNSQIANYTVNAQNLENYTITAEKIANYTVTAGQIANYTVTALKIGNYEITATQIANYTLTASQIANGTITTANIGDYQVTAAKIANYAITAQNIENLTITAAQIANLTITAGQIANNTITDANLATDAVMFSGTRQGLVLHLPFDEGTGSTASDFTEYENNGAITDAYWDDGKFGKAIGFNGATHVVNCGNDASLQLQDDFTILFWFNSANITTDNRNIVSKGYDAAYTCGHRNSHLYFGGPATTNELEGDTVLADGWNLYAVTYDGVTLTFYANGEFDKSYAQTLSFTQAASLLIGQNSYGGLYVGRVDEARIYNRALSAQEVKDLYRLGSIIQFPSVITATMILANAVVSDKIIANAITSDKIAANAVAAGKIAANAVAADQIAANAVTADKIIANAVTADKILANAVTSVKIEANAITADKINAGAVGADQLAVNAVTADKILANAVTSDKIIANSITAVKIDVANARSMPVRSSDTQRNANDTERQTNSTGYVKIKEMVVNEKIITEIRIKYEYKVDESPNNGSFSLRVNGVEIDELVGATNLTYLTRSVDYAVTVEAGDLIQVYAKVNTSTNIAYVQNLRLYYDIDITRSTTSQDP